MKTAKQKVAHGKKWDTARYFKIALIPILVINVFGCFHHAINTLCGVVGTVYLGLFFFCLIRKIIFS